MRGDQLARQWPIIRAVKTSSHWLTVTGIAQREETGILRVYRDLETIQATGFALFTQRAERDKRWASSNPFKFKIFPPFSIGLQSKSSFLRRAI